MVKITCGYCNKQFEAVPEGVVTCPYCKKELKTFKKLSFKERIQSLNPVILKKIEVIGYIGNIVGTIIVIFLFIFLSKKMWWIIFAFVFNVLIQISQLINALQQYNALKTISEKFININNILKEENGV